MLVFIQIFLKFTKWFLQSLTMCPPFVIFCAPWKLVIRMACIWTGKGSQGPLVFLFSFRSHPELWPLAPQENYHDGNLDNTNTIPQQNHVPLRRKLQKWWTREYKHPGRETLISSIVKMMTWAEKPRYEWWRASLGDGTGMKQDGFCCSVFQGKRARRNEGLRYCKDRKTSRLMKRKARTHTYI